jgi:hypothetical protein
LALLELQGLKFLLLLDSEVQSVLSIF